MGTFFEALKKAKNPVTQPSSKPTSSKVVKLPLERIEALRMDTKAQRPHVIGRKPFPGKTDPRLVCLREPSSPAAECFKMLRSKLMVGCSGELRRAIMVTSAHPRDGKSLVSANLAVSIAQGINTYVLLVDCDLRRPSLHTIFGIPAGRGLREYLEEGRSVVQYLRKTPLKKLTLLPAGRPLASPSEFLSSDKMKLLIQELRGRYQDRFIILDSPPAHFTSDTGTLYHLLDGVLLVVRSGSSLREPVKDVVASIGPEKVLGVVLNGNAEVQKDYRTYYRYYQK